MRPLILLAVSACLCGCAGARVDLVAQRAEYPISLSANVRDSSGAVLTKGVSLHKVGHFMTQKTGWGILWSFVRFTPEIDISADANQQIAQAHGEAIVNLTIVSGNCPMNFVPVFNLLPIWPGCVPITISGDIVRTIPPAAASAASRTQAPVGVP